MAESAPYKVVAAERHRAFIRAWSQQAEVLGLGDDFLATVTAIDRNLTERPTIWGDPQYPLRHLGLTVYHGIARFLHVFYAVDEARRIVYIKSFEVFPGGPLDTTP